MNEGGAPTFWLQEQLGFAIDRGDGTATITITCDERHLNPHGTVHGAVVFAMVDTGMGAAATSVLDASSMCATIEIQLRYLSPVFAGAVRAEVRVVKAGRRIVHLDAQVFDHRDKLVATSTGSFAVIPRPAM